MMLGLADGYSLSSGIYDLEPTYERDDLRLAREYVDRADDVLTLFVTLLMVCAARLSI